MAKKTTPSPNASFTDTQRVKDLIALMADNGLSEIELVEDKSRILLRRGSPAGQSAPIHYAPQPAAPAHHAPSVSAATPAEDPTLVAIKSPMVGTFYTAPNPDTDAYVSIGKNVDEKSVVCIIEAMKVFNEIHAEVRGTVTKILVSNGQVVEYGQPLFLVKPN